jgi:NMD protein affecting ribosome stability and mRNA decay
MTEKCTRCGRTEDRVRGHFEDGYCVDCLNLEPVSDYGGNSDR